MKAIDFYHSPDLILTGTQSWAIPPSFIKDPLGSEFNVTQFLFGTQPDAVICAINPNDSIDLINRTLEIVRISCKARVTFFVITPWLREVKGGDLTNSSYREYRVLNEEELYKRIEFYQTELKKPVINIMDSANDDKVLLDIQNVFS